MIELIFIYYYDYYHYLYCKCVFWEKLYYVEILTTEVRVKNGLCIIGS